MTKNLPQAVRLRTVLFDRSNKRQPSGDGVHHVLVVDDEQSIREFLPRFPKKRGYRVSTAATATEAFSVVEQTQLHLVILDLVLAEEDGLELLATLKRQDPNLIACSIIPRPLANRKGCFGKSPRLQEVRHPLPQ